MLIPNTIFRMGSGALAAELPDAVRLGVFESWYSRCAAARAAFRSSHEHGLLPGTHSQLSACVQSLTHLPTCPCLPPQPPSC